MQTISWSIRDVAIGLAVLAAWYGLRFVDPKWLGADSPWLFFAATALPISAFLCAYPIILAKRRGMNDPFRWIGPRKLLVEVLISIPITIVVVAMSLGAEYAVQLISPNASLTPPGWDNLAWTHNRAFVLTFLLWAFTIGPICEEIFFRGFLYNALRMRLPIVVAAIIQSLIFAAIHPFALCYGIAVFGMGIILTAIYEWRKALITPICVHMGNNLIAVLVVVLTMIAMANSPVLGVAGQDHPDGCSVLEVIPETAAAEGNILPGDIITDVDGKRINGFGQLIERIQSHRIGDTIVVGISRSDSRVEVPVTLGARP